MVANDPRCRVNIRRCIVAPVLLSRLSVEAMQDSFDIGNEQQVVFDRDRTQAARHLFFDLEFSIAVDVLSLELPDRPGIRVG